MNIKHGPISINASVLARGFDNLFPKFHSISIGTVSKNSKRIMNIILTSCILAILCSVIIAGKILLVDLTCEQLMIRIMVSI